MRIFNICNCKSKSQQSKQTKIKRCVNKFHFRDGKLEFSLQSGGIRLEHYLDPEERAKAINAQVEYERITPRTKLDAPLTLPYRERIIGTLPYEGCWFGLDNQCCIPRSNRVVSSEGESNRHFPYGSTFALTHYYLFRFSLYSGRCIFSTPLDRTHKFQCVFARYTKTNRILTHYFIKGICIGIVIWIVFVLLLQNRPHMDFVW